MSTKVPNKIILKRTSITGKQPLTTDLEYGELAINYADGVLFYKKNTNEIFPLNSPKNILETDFSRESSFLIDLNGTTNAQAIDSLSTSQFESAEYTAQVTHPEFGKQISKINILYDSTEADSVEYGIVFTQAKLVDFTIFYIGSTIQLMANPFLPDCTVKLVRKLII